MKPSCESDTKAMLDAFLRAVDEGDASPDVEDFDPEAFIANLNKR